MDIASTDHLLETTRSVRKRLDFSRPVPRDVIEKCLEIALQAPSGGNQQNWHFVVVTDPAKRKALGDIYRKGWAVYTQMERPPMAADDPRTSQLPRVVDSAQFLADHFEEAPVMIIPCVEGRVEQMPQFVQASMYGSILPAVWSLMLALRSRGIGSAWTTIHLMNEKEAAAVLGIPDTFTQAALLPVAYFTGKDFKPAERLPLSTVTSWNTWGGR